MAEGIILRKQLREEAMAIGYTDSDINKYVIEQVAAHEAKAEKLRLEQLAREERLEQLAREEKQLEREDRIRAEQLAHEFRLAELAANTRAPDNTDHPNSPSSFSSANPNTPLPRHASLWTDIHDPRLEQFDVYLRRFSDCMELNEVPPELHCRILISTLRGENYETYCKLPPDDRESCTALKNALLNQHQLHASHYQKRFRTATLRSGENYTQYAERIKAYLLKWVELGDIEQSFEGMVTLLMTEQIESQMPPKLKAFLIQQGISGLNPSLQGADRFLQSNLIASSSRPGHPQPHRPYGDNHRANPPPQSTAPQPHTPHHGRPRPHNAHRDHRHTRPTPQLAHDRNRRDPTPYLAAGAFYTTTDPVDPAQDPTNGLATHELETPSYPSYLAPEQETADQGRDQYSSSDYDRVHHVFSISSADKHNQFPRSYVDEIVRINGRLASCTYDSGLSFEALVTQSKIDPRDYTGRYVRLQGPSHNSPIQQLPTALVNLSSALFTGPIEAAVIEGLQVDILLGRPIVGKQTHCLPTPATYGSPRPTPNQTPLPHPMSIKDKLRHARLPTTRLELRQTLGEFSNYQNTLIPNFRKITRPLFRLLNAPTSFPLSWDKLATDAFETLQQCLGQNPFRHTRHSGH